MQRMISHYLFYFSLIFLLIPSCFAYKIFVGNFGDNTISVIDSKSNTVSGSIVASQGPANLSISPDNRNLYVSDSGTYTLTRIDTADNRILSHIEVGKIPQGIGMGSNGKFMIVAIHGTNSVVYVDTKINAVTKKVLVGRVGPLQLNASNSIAYLGLQAPTEFAIGFYDIKKETLANTVALKNSPKELAVHPVSGKIYLTADGVDTVQVVDPNSLKLVKEIPVGPSPRAITFTHDGKLGLTASQNNNILYFFDPQTDTVKDQISVGNQPYAIAVSKDDKTAYVTNEISNNVSVIDLVNKKVMTTIPVGNAPHYIAVENK